MYRSRVLQIWVASIALAVPAGAVGASTTEPDDAPAESTGPAGGQPPQDVEFQIDMLLGLVTDDEMQAYVAQQELAIQECMAEAGFEYEPAVAEDVPADEYDGLSQLEYAQQYGFGVWTMMDPANQQTDPLPEPPNQSMIEALSPEEQDAWYEVSNLCSQEIYAATDDPLSNPMVQQIMEDFRQDVENDQRVLDALAAWQDCMAEAGHPFANHEEMYAAVYGDGDEETWNLQNQLFESQAWLETSPDHEQWRALVDEEIEIAVADATCTPPLTEAREEVTRDLRDDVVAAWQTIDWSLPPVTYEDPMFPADTVVETVVEPPSTTPATPETTG